MTISIGRKGRRIMTGKKEPHANSQNEYNARNPGGFGIRQIKNMVVIVTSMMITKTKTKNSPTAMPRLQ